MQHIHTPTSQFDGHINLWRTVIYLCLAVVGLVALYEHSLALLAVMAGAFALVLALSERTARLDKAPAGSARPASRPLEDGGSFPGIAPEPRRRKSGTTRVLDGGSLEHHRS